MHLRDILEPDCVKVPLEAKDKRAAIIELVGLACQSHQIGDSELLVKAVMDRESTRTTGIGSGLAIPHGKCNKVDKLVMSVGKPAEPIDFDSIDGNPVDLIVLLASPHTQTGPHIQALARISRLMTLHPFRDSLATASTSEQLFNIIKQYDEKIE